MGTIVGTSTLEKKNKDLTRATKELEAKMRNLQQRTENDKVSEDDNTEVLPSWKTALSLGRSRSEGAAPTAYFWRTKQIYQSLN